MILVDSSVWSLALRRRRADLHPLERALTFTLRDLIIEGNTAIIGPVRQEVLSGISSEPAYRNVRLQLMAIPDLPLDNAIWELAAEFFNTCRTGGIAAEAIDMTICAASSTHNTPIFTIDPDFSHYAKHLPITLFSS